MDDLPTQLIAAIEETERAARAVEPLGYVIAMGGNRLDERFTHGRRRFASEDGMPRCDSGDSAAERHFARHDPNRVLRRCAADREMVNLHATRVFETIRGNPEYGHDYWCETCHIPGDQQGRNWCQTLLLLAEGYGITEETDTP